MMCVVGRIKDYSSIEKHFIPNVASGQNKNQTPVSFYLSYLSCILLKLICYSCLRNNLTLLKSVRYVG